MWPMQLKVGAREGRYTESNWDFREKKQIIRYSLKSKTQLKQYGKAYPTEGM